jgi:threonine dehydrogenase-like Zn-dependent dehydrogenase
MENGDILGHEFMGEVVDVGRDVKNLKKGDRVVVPFTIACGHCSYCESGLYASCDNSNPNAWLAEKMYGYSAAALYGYSHIYGGYAGGQAQYARVPFADVGPIKVPEGLTDEQVIFLSDIFPTGYQAAENCNIKPGDVVAVFGCGPIGQFAIRSAFMLGAERVIAMDRVPERLRMAAEGGAEVFNVVGTDSVEELKQRTGGRGPDACIDAVGLESHGTSYLTAIDTFKQKTRLSTDRPNVLRQAIQACGKGGTVSIPGVYGGFLDKIPFGAAFAKGLTFKMGQTNMQRYLQPLMERIQKGEIDPGFIITHRMKLEDAPHGYDIFKHKENDCIKVVLKPW